MGKEYREENGTKVLDELGEEGSRNELTPEEAVQKQFFQSDFGDGMMAIRNAKNPFEPTSKIDAKKNLNNSKYRNIKEMQVTISFDTADISVDGKSIDDVRDAIAAKIETMRDSLLGESRPKDMPGVFEKEAGILAHLTALIAKQVIKEHESKKIASGDAPLVEREEEIDSNNSTSSLSPDLSEEDSSGTGLGSIGTDSVYATPQGEEVFGEGDPLLNEGLRRRRNIPMETIPEMPDLAEDDPQPKRWKCPDFSCVMQ